jgi:DNA-directed RNA polymerase specialized sigma24 family protein
MHHTALTTLDLSLLLTEAEAAAARLRPRLPLPVDHDDLRQDLLVDLLRRLPAFDPARGGLGAVAGRLLRNRAMDIAALVARERRAAGGTMLSLDATNGDGTSLSDRLSDEDGLAAWFGSQAAAATAERRIDLGTAVERLEHRDRALCLALVHNSVDQLVDRGFGSRAGLYRRLHDLRLTLIAYGLRAA